MRTVSERRSDGRLAASTSGFENRRARDQKFPEIFIFFGCESVLVDGALRSRKSVSAMAALNPILTALSEEQLLFENELASVTQHCVIVRTAEQQAHILLPLSRISSLKKVQTSRPAFLAIAAGLFLIAAAAQISKEGGGAAIPIALFGICSLVAYLVSRRAAVVFIVDKERTETPFGGLRQASALITSVQAAYERIPA